MSRQTPRTTRTDTHLPSPSLFRSVEEAQRLVQASVGDKVTVVNRLKTATPMQVSLHVKIAEVSRDLMKEIGVNLLAANNSGSFRFGMGRDFLNDSGQL